MAWKLTCYQCNERKPIDQYRIVEKVREPGYHKGERVRVCKMCEWQNNLTDVQHNILTRAWQ